MTSNSLRRVFAWGAISPHRVAKMAAVSLSAAWLLSASWTQAAPPSAEAALALRPVQSEAKFEEVPEPKLAQCRVADIEREDWSGWEVTSPEGLVLRRFADTNGDKKVDLWCYFLYGVEAYRDVDSNFNGKADQYRWMGMGGMRWGLDDNEDGKIDRWKMISAEEVTAELIASLATGDASRFAALVASARELQQAGLTGDRLDTLTKKTERATAKFATFANEQKVIGPTSKWIQFASSAPGVVPADSDGVTSDLIAYENAVAMFESEGTPGQLLVGTILRVGETWKLVDLPVVAAAGEPIAQSSGNFFTPGQAAANMAAASGNDSKTQELVTALESIDGKLVTASDPKEIAALNARRADVVERLVDAATPAERDTWVRQLVDTVSVATQSGAYPDGLQRLQKLAKSLRGTDESLRAYTEYQLIGTEYITRQTPNADFAKIQEWWLGELTGFVDRFPQSAETAQAKLQLALNKEFEDKEADALQYYKEVVRDFRGTDAAEKAAGAVRRLDSVGKAVELEGRTIDGKLFRLSQLKGRPVVIHYWATWCEPCKQDMKLLRSLQARYQRAGLQLVGVNIDNSRQQAGEFINSVSIPWTQLFEEGGLEGSPLAKQFGVQTLPTMMLVDAQGRLVRHNIRAAELDEAIGEMVQPTKK